MALDHVSGVVNKRVPEMLDWVFGSAILAAGAGIDSKALVAKIVNSRGIEPLANFDLRHPAWMAFEECIWIVRNAPK